MEKARRPSWGLGLLPVWLHSPKEPTVPFLFIRLLSSPLPSPRRFFLTVWAFSSESSRVRVVRAGGPGAGLVRVSRAAVRAGVRDWRRLVQTGCGRGRDSHVGRVRP